MVLFNYLFFYVSQRLFMVVISLYLVTLHLNGHTQSSYTMRNLVEVTGDNQSLILMTGVPDIERS